VTRKQRVLFLCRDNAALSIFAEALLRELDGLHFDAFSAGLEPADKVHEAAMGQLRHGFSSLDLLNPKSWMEFTSEWAPQMDIVITMCAASADVDMRAFHGRPEWQHWTIADPQRGEANETQRPRPFVNAFWQILKRVEVLIATRRQAWPASNRSASVGCAPENCEFVSGR
jgi:arsenate reductase